MRIFLTIICVVGGWFAMAFISPMIYSMGVDVPGIDISQNVFRYAGVAIIGLLAWAKLD